MINVRWRTADEDVSRLVTMDGKSPVSRRRYAWWRFVGAPSADVVDLLDGSNVDRRCPRSVHAVVGSERRCRRVLWKRFGGGTVLNPRQLREEGMRFILP